VPESDAFDIFPRLFKKNYPKRLCGFQDVVRKIKAMGLAHLLETQQKGEGKIEDMKNNQKDHLNSQWWYLGD